MRIKLFSNYLPLLCLTACVWVSCSQNREKKSGEERSYAGDAVNHDHDRGAAVVCSGCTSRTVCRGET